LKITAAKIIMIAPALELSEVKSDDRKNSLDRNQQYNGTTDISFDIIQEMVDVILV